ncbi:16S rRNA (cytosine(1402)-N(4))-methyltransferase RsmH [Arsenophonus symbiont of Ornithomya chloropus]|uniref:16S rRNA (cytosine(1402)-N(4))-methyltransferase RsmH n=1 Tax=Arsenophonus symbiont of Ornithomya chloropus TaxID=634121 RepID=UPI0032B19F38
MINYEFLHITVLLEEAVNVLQLKKNGIYVDATFGRGGHSKLILSRLGKKGRLLAIDRDPKAVMVAKNMITDFRFSIKHANFSQLESLIKKEGLIGKIDGLLLDLGISSHQLDDAKRGFSFLHNGPLDMRMNPEKGQSAASWLMQASESDIAWVLKTYGEERFSKKIAKAIFFRNHYSKKTVLSHTKQLSELIVKIIPFKKNYKHPATRTFQAIRIYINNELEEIKIVLENALNILAPKGRLSIISFNSLEDRLVKRFMKKHSMGSQFPSKLPLTDIELKMISANPILKILGKIKPTQEEVLKNPRARSSILRYAEILE